MATYSLSKKCVRIVNKSIAEAGIYATGIAGNQITDLTPINAVFPGELLYNTADGVFSTVNIEGDLVLIGSSDLSLNSLSDVNVPSPLDGQVLSYDLATSEWIATTASVGVTYSVSNGLTQSGTNFKLGGTLTQDTTIDASTFYNMVTKGNSKSGWIDDAYFTLEPSIPISLLGVTAINGYVEGNGSTDVLSQSVKFMLPQLPGAPVPGDTYFQTSDIVIPSTSPDEKGIIGSSVRKYTGTDYLRYSHRVSQSDVTMEVSNTTGLFGDSIRIYNDNTRNNLIITNNLETDATQKGIFYAGNGNDILANDFSTGWNSTTPDSMLSTKGYVDRAVSGGGNFLPLAGGTMDVDADIYMPGTDANLTVGNNLQVNNSTTFKGYVDIYNDTGVTNKFRFRDDQGTIHGSVGAYGGNFVGTLMDFNDSAIGGNTTKLYSYNGNLNIINDGSASLGNPNFSFKTNGDFELYNGKFIGDGSGLTNLPGGSGSQVSYHQFSSGSDNDAFYDDGTLEFSWNAPAGRPEVKMLTVPGGTGGMRCLASEVDGTTQNTYITIANFTYSLFTAGVSGGERLEMVLSSEQDPSFPFYKITVYNTGGSYNTSFVITKIN